MGRNDKKLNTLRNIRRDNYRMKNTIKNYHVVMSRMLRGKRGKK